MSPTSWRRSHPEPAYTPVTDTADGVEELGDHRQPEPDLDAAPATSGGTPDRLPPGTTPAGIRHTRAGAAYTGLVLGAVVVVLLLIFIVQNLDTAPLHLFGWTFDVPLGVSILLSAILGALVVGLAGTVRIVQVRRAAKRK